MPDRREVLLAGVSLALMATGVDAAENVSGLTFASALGRCVESGNVCLEHCLKSLAKGDTTLAECSVAVRDMLAVCNAVAVLAAAQSKFLKSAARLCIDVCENCEKACRVHQDHHAECKACAEACAGALVEARQLAA